MAYSMDPQTEAQRFLASSQPKTTKPPGRPSKNSQKLWTEKDLAQELGIPRGALVNARRFGLLKFTNIGRTVYLKMAWVDDWLERTAILKQEYEAGKMLQRRREEHARIKQPVS
jgi:hypothetical protein